MEKNNVGFALVDIDENEKPTYKFFKGKKQVNYSDLDQKDKDLIDYAIREFEDEVRRSIQK